MLHLTKLHGLAAQRGDGLRPELLELARRYEHDRRSDLNLAVIHHDRVAGARPQARPCDGLPENVVHFRPIADGK